MPNEKIVIARCYYCLFIMRPHTRTHTLAHKYTPERLRDAAGEVSQRRVGQTALDRLVRFEDFRVGLLEQRHPQLGAVRRLRVEVRLGGG
jgi:hypothetical protein